MGSRAGGKHTQEHWTEETKEEKVIKTDSTSYSTFIIFSLMDGLVLLE